jgi:hypothetical protein
VKWTCSPTISTSRFISVIYWRLFSNVYIFFRQRYFFKRYSKEYLSFLSLLTKLRLFRQCPLPHTFICSCINCHIGCPYYLYAFKWLQRDFPIKEYWNGHRLCRQQLYLPIWKAECNLVPGCLQLSAGRLHSEGRSASGLTATECMSVKCRWGWRSNHSGTRSE